MNQEPETIILLEPSEDCTNEFRYAIEKLSAVSGSKCLRLSQGRYVFRKKDACVQKLPVSNTVIQSDAQFKHIGLLLQDLEDFTLEGNHAELIFDGDMSAIVLDHCSRICLKDFSVDYVYPRVSEMTLIDSGDSFGEFEIHPSSRWGTDEQGRFCFINGDGLPETWDTPQVVQLEDPEHKSNLRTGVNPVREAVSFEKTGDRTVRFYYDKAPKFRAGEVWQFRDPSRRENGIVIQYSQSVTLQSLKLYFTPGLGIVAQMTKDLTIRDHRHAPRKNSQRVCAAFADCIQISSCYGNVEIANSFFSGAQDDPINVHGTYLGVEKAEGKELFLRFCHPETWGWLPFQEGDEITFVRRKNLQRTLSSFRVVKAVLTDPVSVHLTLDRTVTLPEKAEELVLENLSAYPDVSIHDCIFERYPTRGILMTSAGKCSIYNNEIRQTSLRAGIFISGDANSWYESGGVRDLSIYGNCFRSGRTPSIVIQPEVTPGLGAVHGSIRVEGNIFEECAPILLTYHSTSGLTTDLQPQRMEEIKKA